MPITHLSRQELMSLLYDKLQTIRDEADDIVNPDARKPSDLPSAKLRLKRIAVEARRAASLIETYELVSKAGHCLHCGKTYASHEERSTRPERRCELAREGPEPRRDALQRAQVDVRIGGARDVPRCSNNGEQMSRLHVPEAR